MKSADCRLQSAVNSSQICCVDRESNPSCSGSRPVPCPLSCGTSEKLKKESDLIYWLSNSRFWWGSIHRTDLFIKLGELNFLQDIVCRFDTNHLIFNCSGDCSEKNCLVKIRYNFCGNSPPSLKTKQKHIVFEKLSGAYRTAFVYLILDKVSLLLLFFNTFG